MQSSVPSASPGCDRLPLCLRYIFVNVEAVFTRVGVSAEGCCSSVYTPCSVPLARGVFPYKVQLSPRVSSAGPQRLNPRFLPACEGSAETDS